MDQLGPSDGWRGGEVRRAARNEKGVIEAVPFLAVEEGTGKWQVAKDK